MRLPCFDLGVLRDGISSIVYMLGVWARWNLVLSVFARLAKPLMSLFDLKGVIQLGDWQAK